MGKRLLATVMALVLIFALTTTAFAASIETFYGGYNDGYTKGSIVVELTNISSKKNVILSKKDAAGYFDNAETLDLEVYYDYDTGEQLTIWDIVEQYNNEGGVPTYYADTAPVVVTAKTALYAFDFYNQGENEANSYEPKYYSQVDYYYNFDNKKAYIEPPDFWLLADGTLARLNQPGKYLFLTIDDGLLVPSRAGIFCVHIGDAQTEPTAPKDIGKINAKPTSSKVLVNGKVVEFDAYNIKGNNYFKLRDLAQAVNNTDKNFEVTWDGKNNAINLISNKAYTPVGGELVKGDGKAKLVAPTTSKIYKDGEEVSLTAYKINDNNYFKLRDIAKLFNIGVTWDGATNTVVIDTSVGYVEE